MFAVLITVYRNCNIFSIRWFILRLLENYDTAKKYMDISANSEGIAEEKYGAYLDNLEAKTNSLKASLQNLATSTISDNAYAGFLDGSKAVVDFIEKTDLLKSSLEGLGVSGGLFAFQKIAGWVSDAAHEFNNLNSALQMLKSAESIGNILDADEFDNLIQLTSGLSESQLRLVVSSTALSDAQRVAVLMSTGMSQAQAQATVATMGLSTAQGTATGTTLTLSGALQGLWSTLMANPLVLVAAGITAACTAWNAYNRSVEEAVSTAKSAGTKWEESNTSIQDNISKITELRSALDSGKLTEQEAYDTKSQLLDIQNQLSESYGSQAQGIDLINGKYDEQIAKIKELTEAQANQFLTENKKGIDKAKKEMEKETTSYLGDASLYSEEGQKLQEIANKYKDKGIFTQANESNGTFTIHFKGDATEAKSVLNDFATDVRGLQDEIGESDFTNNILSYTSAELSARNEILDEYQSLYNQAMKADLQTDKTNYGGKTATEWLNNYSKAVENYNKAVSEGNAEEIDKAKSYYKAMDSSIQTLLSGSDMSQYKSLFTDVSDQLDTATIKAQEFNLALTGEGTNGYQKRLKFIVDKIKEMNLSDVDFKASVNSGDVEIISYLAQQAEQAGMSTDDLAQALVNLGVVSGQPTSGLEETANSIDGLVESSNTLISQINAVNSVLSSQATGKSISLDC